MILLASVLPVTGRGLELAHGVANVAVFMLFFLYGLRLPRRDVIEGLGDHVFLVPLVIWVFGAMTLAGWIVWKGIAGLAPADVALGFLFLGVLPSTVQSATVYSSIAGGNVASSVIAAALLNIAGVFVSAPLFSLLAGNSEAGLAGDVIVKILVILLLPFLLGQGLQGFTRSWVQDHRKLIGLLDRGVIGLAVYVAFSGAVEQDVWMSVSAKAWAAILAGVAVLLAFAHAGAWTVGGLVGLAREKRISFLFGGAQKSIAMGAPLATVLFPAALAGIVLLPLLAYHLIQMMVAAVIASRLNPPSEVAD